MQTVPAHGKQSGVLAPVGSAVFGRQHARRPPPDEALAARGPHAVALGVAVVVEPGHQVAQGQPDDSLRGTLTTSSDIVTGHCGEEEVVAHASCECL